MFSHTIDLEALSLRESESVEWKENVADVDDVVRTLVAFANDLNNLGGGYVVCGAREVRDEHGFQKMVRTGMTSSRLKEIEGRVLSRCRERVSPPLTPLVDELPGTTEETRILVFTMPASKRAHTFRTDQDSGLYYVRLGRETREARNGLMKELMVQKGDLEPWDLRPNGLATAEDIDQISLGEALIRMGALAGGRSPETYLNSELSLAALSPSLMVREPLTGVLRPRNFTLLLFGRDIQRFIPGAVTVISTYPGTTRASDFAQKEELTGNLFLQGRRLLEVIESQSILLMDKTSLAAPNNVKYPARALREAVVNALVHRSYDSPEITRITVFEDRIEISSPGPLPRGLDVDKLSSGRGSAFWRNRALAWSVIKLGWAQAEGQGIPTLLREMALAGCPPPEFAATPESFSCTLRAHPSFRKFKQVQQRESGPPLDEETRMKIKEAFHHVVVSVEPRPVDRAEAVPTANALREKLRKEPSFGGIERDVIAGSVMRGTATDPMHDVDVFLILDPRVHTPPEKVRDPASTLERLEKGLRAVVGPGGEVKRQHRSVHVRLPETRVEFDFVPAFRHPSLEGVYWIPDASRNDWIYTHPEKHHAALKEANTRAGSKLIPLIKVMKAWNRQRPKAERLQSFYLEVMCYDAFQAPPTTLPEGFAQLAEHLAAMVLRKCPDPARVGPHIDDGATPEVRQAREKVFKSLALTARAALALGAQGKLEDAHAMWRQVFGDLWPAEPLPD